MADPLETELKLALSEAAFAKLAESPRLATADPARIQRLVATYYDTDAGDLARRGFSLRVRDEDGERRQTLKAEGAPGAAMQRGEWEWRLDGDAPDLPRLAETPAAAFADAQVRPRFVTDVTRAVHVVAFEDAQIEAAFDVGEIRAGERRLPLRELELELRDGPLIALYRLALALLEEAPFAVETESKAGRGRRLAAGERPRASTAQPRKLPPDLPAALAFRLILGEALGHMLASAAAARAGEAEGVHQWRVAVRRLRSALRLFAAIAERESRERFDRDLQTLGRRIGEARDWSVFCDVASAPGPMADAARRRREETLADAAALAEERAFTKLALSLAAWAEASAQLRERDAGRPLREVAPDWVAALARTAAKRRRKAKRGGFADVHRLRKALKRLRYAVEFLDGVVGVSARRRKRLKKALKRLGRLTDAEMTMRRAAELGSTQGAPFESRRDATKRALRLARKALKLKIRPAASA